MTHPVITNFIAAWALSGFLASPTYADTCNSIDSLEWLFGHWESRNENSVTTETWTRASENAIEVRGMTLSLPDFNVSFLESIIVAPFSGEIYYTAKAPQNPYPVSFKLTDCSEVSAVFENTDHDFPSRIAYYLVEAGRLRVDVSGPDGNGFSVHLAKRKLDRQIALTFDDAPRSDSAHFSGEERTNRLIESLENVNSPPVIFFSTTRGIDQMGDARMRSYQTAGHYIANHTHTHQRIDKLGVDAYIDDIKKAHKILSQYENFVSLFRFPFLDEGKDEETRDRLRLELSALGYSNGYVTVDNYDFYMDSLFQTALKQGRAVNYDKLGKAYVESQMESVRFYADVAERHLGMAPAHTLLLHENDLAAMFIGDLIKALRSEGWAIIDARKAFEDPIANVVTDTLFNGQGRVAAMARVGGVARADLVHRAEDTYYLEQYFKGRDVFGPQIE